VTTAGEEPSAATGNEVELKYRVTDPSTGERLIAADELAGLTATGAKARTVRIEDRYVDTAEGGLARAGFVARLRQRGDETIVSLKSIAKEDGPGGSFRRVELEGAADRVAPPVDWPPSDARSLVLEHAGDAPFVETVTVRQVRRKRILKADATRVELSLDAVEVIHRGRIAARFVELEAELVKGDDEVLARLAAVLDTEAGLVRAAESKLEAAMAALAAAGDAGPGDVDGDLVAADEPAAPRLVVGKTPGVLADDHVAEAGRKVLRFHLARMLDYEPGTRTGEDPEDLHKMRVATRRQRAAWRVFGEGFRDGRTRRYRAGLREVAGRLGAVRDLDVQLEAADLYRADLPATEQRALEPLVTAWRGHREDARALLLRDLDGDRYRRWLDDYVDFVRTEGAAVRAVVPTTPHRVRDTAPSRIWAAYEGVRAYEPVLRWADVETLHDLRISGKWLRYTLEFVREALGPEATPLIARVTALQDHIGLMHDADLTASLARTFLVEQGSSLSPVETAAIGRYLIDRERETARLRRTIGVPWRGLAGPGFRRGLGRVVAGL
jgi:CHAD domain-containing protein